MLDGVLKQAYKMFKVREKCVCIGRGRGGRMCLDCFHVHVLIEYKQLQTHFQLIIIIDF